MKCTVGLLKKSRHLATRCVKLALHHLGVLELSMLRTHLKRLAISSCERRIAGALDNLPEQGRPC